MGGPAPPQKKCGGLGPCGTPVPPSMVKMIFYGGSPCVYTFRIVSLCVVSLLILQAFGCYPGWMARKYSSPHPQYMINRHDKQRPLHRKCRTWDYKNDVRLPRYCTCTIMTSLLSRTKPPTRARNGHKWCRDILHGGDTTEWSFQVSVILQGIRSAW